ncbi:MAG TPA: amidohydrolase family protein [Caulobacteraceae bacterium]|nr:amidohydrolase family protein [Caulobacteraceae bacterium]
MNFNVPKGACNCHTHIFDPEHYPYAASRPYSPAPATIADVRALNRALHIDRVVISQPTVYGDDHACTLNAIKTIGASARGVAAYAPNTSSARLDELHRGGMRGLVVHNIGEYKDAAAQIGARPWNVEVYVGMANMAAFKDMAMASNVTAKLTLFGGVQRAADIHTPAFAMLQDLLRSGKVYVELSTPSHISTQEPDYADTDAVGKALIAANPERITWGSDWPHAKTLRGKPTPGIAPLENIDDAISLNMLPRWTTGPDQVKLILVDNAARLYGF